MLFFQSSRQTLAALIEVDVFDLVPEHHGELVFAVHIGEDAGAHEDLPAGKTDGAAERGARIEAEAVWNFALRMGDNFIAHGLQVLVELVGLRSRLHALLGDEVVGEDHAKPDLICVGDGGRLRWGEEEKCQQGDCGTHRLRDGREGCD